MIEDRKTLDDRSSLAYVVCLHGLRDLPLRETPRSPELLIPLGGACHFPPQISSRECDAIFIGFRQSKCGFVQLLG
jgi:hypothetical protein